MSEVEASGIGFQIDHFDPQANGGPNVHDYANLMWSCEKCNNNKRRISPTPQQVQRGFRYVRPDMDDPNEHYKLVGYRLIELSKAGEFTIQVLFLNSDRLKKLRELRSRFFAANSAIAFGLQGLKDFRVDKLKPEMRARFAEFRDQMSQKVGALSDSEVLGRVIRVLNRSPYLDPDPDVRERPKKRRAYLASIHVIEPLQIAGPETDDAE